MKKWIWIALAAVVVILLLMACGKLMKKNNEPTLVSNHVNDVPKEVQKEEEPKVENEYLSGTYDITMEIKDYGTIEATLDADLAPITVTNFVNLAKQGFYDGLTFHRIIDGFMIQGGDPEGTGFGGAGKNIKGEFAQNGVSNNLSHQRGVISMARSSSPNSASSQFFIVHQDATYLDGAYAAFGKVTSGMEIVDHICEETKVEDDNGTVLKANQPVITKITVKE